MCWHWRVDTIWNRSLSRDSPAPRPFSATLFLLSEASSPTPSAFKRFTRFWKFSRGTGRALLPRLSIPPKKNKKAGMWSSCQRSWECTDQTFCTRSTACSNCPSLMHPTAQISLTTSIAPNSCILQSPCISLFITLVSSVHGRWAQTTFFGRTSPR